MVIDRIETRAEVGVTSSYQVIPSTAHPWRRTETRTAGQNTERYHPPLLKGMLPKDSIIAEMRTDKGCQVQVC